MNKIVATVFAACAIALASMAAHAGSHTAWELDSEASKIAFGSVKKDTVGETHSFTGLSGGVSGAGEVMIAIDLASVETWIDIRNERIIEHVFNNMPEATLSANLDMDKLNALAVGDAMTMPVEAKLALMGNETVIQTDMFVLRLAEGKVLVSTDEMTWLSTEELGIDAGVSKLMELAKLPSITRAVPFTARLVFTR